MTMTPDSLSLADANARFAELMDRAEHGEEIVIMRAGKPVVRLLPAGKSARRAFGQFPDMVISDDFDAPLTEEELAEWEA